MAVENLFTPTELVEMDEVYASALLDSVAITNPVPRDGSVTATTFTSRCSVLKPTRARKGGGLIQPIGKDVEWTIALPRLTNVLTKARLVVTESNRYPEALTRTLEAGEIIRGGSYDPAVFVETIVVPS